MPRLTRYRYRKSKRASRKTRRIPKRKRMFGGNQPDWMQPILAEAARIQTLATSMDEYNLPFLIAGSTAVAAYLHELLTADVGHLTAAEAGEGLAALTVLKKPDDLDFKYRHHGALFERYIIDTESKPQAPTSNVGLPTLNLSFLQKSDDCGQYIDLAEYRCCEPWEENPIFKPQQATLFSKVEFHAPQEFKRKRMHAAKIGELELLGMEDLSAMYEKHKTIGNAPKLVALGYINRMIAAHNVLAEKYVGN